MNHASELWPTLIVGVSSGAIVVAITMFIAILRYKSKKIRKKQSIRRRLMKFQYTGNFYEFVGKVTVYLILFFAVYSFLKWIAAILKDQDMPSITNLIISSIAFVFGAALMELLFMRVIFPYSEK